MKALLPATLAVLLAVPAFAQTPPAVPDLPPAAKLPPAGPPSAGPSKSARFRLQVGHIFLGLTCPDDEPLSACEQFAMHLLDKAEALQKH